MPFLSADLDCPRVHHVFSDAIGAEAWSDKELSEASDAVEPALMFRLSDHRLLVGSAHLVLPNPVLRAVDTRLSPGEENEDILLRLIARTGMNLSGLSVELWENRDTAVQRLARFTPAGPLTRVALRGPRSEVGVRIEDTTHGCIYDSVPAPFIRSFQLNVGLMTDERRVVIDRGAKGVHQYTARPLNADRRTRSGTETKRGALDAIRDARLVAEADRRVAALDEVFFVKQEWETAHEVLRRLVGRAQERVRVVDYFFSADDAALLVPAVQSFHAQIEILTSKEGLGIIAHGSATPKDEARRLATELDELRTKFRMQPAETRLMRGSSAEIHDRFLVVDAQVFLLGSSLNEYGSRGTMLVRLRYPERVMSRLDEAWSRAQPLAGYAAETEGGEA